MARNLEQLQKQYSSASATQHTGRGPGGPGGGGPRGGGPRGGMMMGGKPKDAKKSLLRIMHYLDPYKCRFLIVLLCMLISSVTSLFGAYLLAPIIDKNHVTVLPNANKGSQGLSANSDKPLLKLPNGSTGK